MKKKIYTVPQVEVFKMDIQRTLAASEFHTLVNDPTEEVDADDAL